MDYYNFDKKGDTVLYRCDNCGTFLKIKSHLSNHLRKCESNQDGDTATQKIDRWSVVTFPFLSVCLDKLDDFRVIVPSGDETSFDVVKTENDEMELEETDAPPEILKAVRIYNYRPSDLTKPIVPKRRFNDPSLKCKGCNRTLYSQCLYDRHISQMNQCNPTIQPHPCPHSGCKRIFFEASKLSIHLLSHQKPSAASLRGRIHRTRNRNTVCRQLTDPTKEAKPRPKFSDNMKKGRENKLEKKNSNNLTGRDEDDDTVSSPKCEKIDHSQSHTCSICGETFRLPASLRVHMAKDHGNEGEIRTSATGQEKLKLSSSNPTLLLNFGGNFPNKFGQNYQTKVVDNDSRSSINVTNDENNDSEIQIITPDAIKLEIKEEVDIDLCPVKFEVMESDTDENVWYC